MKGKPISRGRARGPLTHLQTRAPQGPALSIHPSKIEHEIARYRYALSTSKQDLKSLQTNLDSSDEASGIIDSHIQMLEDPMITTEMEGHIRTMLSNTETVFHSVMGKYEEKFFSRADDFFKERLLDVRDVSKRILSHLDPSCGDAEQPKECIIYAEELGPSDIIDLAPGALAFVTKKGGSSSHSALIARARGIPFVSGLDLSDIPAGTELLVDGGSGEVELNPTTNVPDEEELMPVEYPPEIKRFANVSDLADLQKINSDIGIGLFRTEFPFLGRELALISEDEQYTLYRKVVDKAKGLSVTFRLFDVGGDKIGPKEEVNPALGMRGIRYLLKHQEILRRQLRSILRVSHFGSVNILIPMVTDVSEVRACKEVLYECQTEVGGTVSLGAMIEVPAAAILADEFAEECDFLSIGSNDLTQYTLASCRNEGELYDQMHSSVLKLIGLVIDLAGKTPVILCGDLAARREAIPILVSLGVSAVSVP